MRRAIDILRKHRRRLLQAGGVLLGSYALVLILSYAVPLPARLSAEPSTVIEFRDGSPAHVFLSPDEKWRLALPLDEIDPAYVDALVRFEDKRFWVHGGVDPIAVARAVALNVTHGRRVSGASTLTMQLVRVLEPRPRTLRSKFVEALRAVQLEVRLSKREILEAYLTFAPYGRNVEGVEAASLGYFGHRATSLSASEIAILLAVPQNPNRRFPDSANVERLTYGRDVVAKRLAEDGVLPLGETGDSATVLAEVLASHVPSVLQRLPRHAPHAAVWIRGEVPAQRRVRSTLDRGTQLLAERVLAGARDEAERKGIHNTAVVIADHEAGDIVALVGSFDFWDEKNGGQIVGFALPRSPGSTLKPFLYALAIDRGVAGPQFLVPDIPMAFGGYTPKNFDGSFAGLVTMEDALSRSLNLPFVSLLHQIGTEPFIGTMRDMGVRSLDSEPGHYGLSAAVGGIEMTPLEIAGLYATLAHDGRYRPLRWNQDAPITPESDIVSPGAAWLTRQALSIKDRPDFPARRQLTGAPTGIHWKTGTSFGHRDAWAAGSAPGYTAVVWMGNFDQSSSKELVGSEASGPVLFDLLEALTDRTRRRMDGAAPKDLTQIEVCSYSGRLPGPACPSVRPTLARRSAVPTATCPYHVGVDVDLATGRALTASCRSGRDYATRTFLTWPATVRRWLKDEHRLLPEPPVYDSACERGGVRKPPSIVNPGRGQVAMLLAGVAPDAQEVPFEAETNAAGAQLSWFVDGEFLGTVKSDERLWWKPALGIHEIVVSDDAGLSTRRVFEVRNRVQ